MKNTSSNIGQALKSDYRYHVINANEVHSFHTLEEAQNDKKDGEYWQEKNGIHFKIEIVDKENADEFI